MTGTYVHNAKTLAQLLERMQTCLSKMKAGNPIDTKQAVSDLHLFKSIVQISERSEINAKLKQYSTLLSEQRAKEVRLQKTAATQPSAIACMKTSP